MKTFSALILIALASSLLCSDKDTQPAPAVPKKVLFMREKSGLFALDPVTEKEKFLTRLADSRPAVPNSLVFENGIIQYETSGDLKFRSNHKIANEHEYTKYRYSFDPKTGEHWLSSEIFYFSPKAGKLVIQLSTYSPNQTLIKRNRVEQPFKGMGSSRGLVEYNEDAERFFSKSVTISGKFLFSREGSIFSSQDGNVEVLVPYKGHFDRKFGSGYTSPILTSNAAIAYFVDMGEFGLFSRNDNLSRVDVNSKEKTVIMAGEYNSIKLSSDDKFILFARDGHFEPDQTWTYDIYILNIQRWTLKHVGRADQAAWFQ